MMKKNTSIPSVLPVYNRIDLIFERGDGSWLWDKEGKRYLDCATGIAVNGLGHAHPHLVSTLKAAAEKPWHVSNLFRNEPLERLADRLVAHSFAETVFLCNSGAEAVEACIKMARRYFHSRGDGHKNRIITFEGAFHGRTMATISAAGSSRLTEGFAPLLDGFDQVPFGDKEALEVAISDSTAAILIEPIQGEGGIIPVEKDFLQFIRELCDRYDLLFIMDEVQCGIGRTGRLFAHQLSRVEPDILASAKGLGGGFPIGACLANARAASGMTFSSHGSTFGGNPLASSVANAVLDIVLDPDFLQSVEQKGIFFRKKLDELATHYSEHIELVRGTGLMLGIKIKGDHLAMAAKFRDHGLLSVPAADNIVRMLPPMTISEEEMNEAVMKIEEVLKSVN